MWQSCRSTATVTVGILVERQDNEWRPFIHSMFYIKQRKEVGVVDWASESVNLLCVLGGVPGQKTMKIGERRRYWARIEVQYWEDYYGEGDQDVVFLKVRRAK